VQAPIVKAPFALKLSYDMSMPAPPASARVGYSVQVYAIHYAGRFTRAAVDGLKKRFEPSLQSWQQRGYAPYLYKSVAADANLVIGICIGNFARQVDASALARQIQQHGQAVAAVVPVELHADGSPLPIDAAMTPATSASTAAAALAARSNLQAPALTLMGAKE
jgi:hypothetical protein